MHKAGTVSVNKAVIVGWAMELTGTAVWLYGWLTTGHPSLIHWDDFSPRWIADYLRNIESELGLGLVIAGLIPIYWPRRR